MAKRNNTSKNNASRLRIIGGMWRSRMLPIVDAEGLRPTTDRVRETVFNWLQPYVFDASVLDAFAGSGALGFEALSRSAASATLLEKNKQAAKNLADNARTLNADNAKVIHADTLNWLKNCEDRFNLIFLDPPFNKDLLPECIELITAHNILKDNGWIYIESECELSDLPIPENWYLHREKKAGQVVLRLFQNEVSQD